MQTVDPIKKTLTACFPEDAGFPQACFRMQYDHLIVSVGSTNNTFGVKGVQEHCFFFKGIRDAAKLRRHISECFERAALPYTSPEVCDLSSIQLAPLDPIRCCLSFGRELRSCSIGRNRRHLGKLHCGERDGSVIVPQLLAVRGWYQLSSQIARAMSAQQVITDHP